MFCSQHTLSPEGNWLSSSKDVQCDCTKEERQCGRKRLDSEMRVTKSHVRHDKKATLDPDGGGKPLKGCQQRCWKTRFVFLETPLSVLPEDGQGQRH